MNVLLNGDVLQRLIRLLRKNENYINSKVYVKVALHHAYFDKISFKTSFIYKKEKNKYPRIHVYIIYASYLLC